MKSILEHYPELNQIAESYGWREVPSKNQYMFSFKKDEDEKDEKNRINFYYSTRTMTIQSGRNFKTNRIIKNCTNEDFEKALIDLQ